MKRYIKVDVISLLRDYKYNQDRIKEIQEQIEEYPEIRALSYSENIKLDKSGDPVAEYAARLELLKEKLDRYKYYIKITEMALEKLTEEEKYIVQKMIIEESSISKICSHLNLSAPSIYLRRREAINKIEEILKDRV